MIAVKLPALDPIMAKSANFLAVLASNKPDLKVAGIVYCEDALCRIGPEGDRPHRARTQSRGFINELFHKSTIGLEDLNPVIETVADVEQTVLGEPYAMDNAELLGRRRLRILGADLKVGGRLTVGAPLAFELSCAGASTTNRR